MIENNLTNDVSVRKFDFIVKKLLRTINAYIISFDELGDLKRNVKFILEVQQDLPPVTRLENISSLLKEQGINSYIIRLLHNEMFNDLEAYKNNRDIDTLQDIYWEY